MVRKLAAAIVVACLVYGIAHAQEKRGVTIVPRKQVQTERARRWAVLIGVDKYEDETGIGSLKYCAQDMKLLYRVLTGPNGGFEPENVLLMTGDAAEHLYRPTRSNIVRMVPNWLKDARPEDDVLIAFSGHGIEEEGNAYLLPRDAVRANPRLTALPLSLIREWLEACRARRKILVVDACHAGAGKDAPAMSRTFWNEVDRGEGFIRLASCGPRQKSNEDAKLQSAVGKGHGVFTYYLAEGLEGKGDYDRDGRVDVDEAYRYAYNGTRGWARRKGVEQSPMKSGRVTGMMTIGYYRDLDQLQRDRKAAAARIKDLKRRSRATAGDAARKAIEEARRKEAEALRKLEARLRELESGDAGGGDALKQYQVARAQVATIEKELARKREDYTDGSAVVRSLSGKLSAARAEQERHLKAAMGPMIARLQSLQRQQAEMRKEMRPTHPKMKQIAARIQSAENDLAPFLPGPVKLSIRQMVAAFADGVPPTIELDLGREVTMKLVYIPAGEFMMGSNKGDSDEKPVHKAKITRPFYMGIHEVTQAQYEAVMGTNPSGFKGASNPVEEVSWNDCVEFCKRLSRKTGRTLRLPTEAEWEYACRAGATSRFCFGDSDSGLGEYAWYGNNSGGKTHPVGGKKANAFGLYDMHGNVWEWCADWYDGGYYKQSPTDDPRGPRGGKTRVLRGGSWDGTPWFCRSALRGGLNPTDTCLDLGFRVVALAVQEFN